MTRDEVIDLFLVKLCEHRKAVINFMKTHDCELCYYEVGCRNDRVFLTIHFKSNYVNEFYGAEDSFNVSFLADEEDENVQMSTVETSSNYIRHRVLQNAVRVLKSKEGKRNDTR